MGWWKVERTSNTIGDGPLDSLGASVAEVIDQYQIAFNRKPTKAEWEALLRAVLGGDSPEERVVDEGVVDKVSIELS